MAIQAFIEIQVYIQFLLYVLPSANFRQSQYVSIKENHKEGSLRVSQEKMKAESKRKMEHKEKQTNIRVCSKYEEQTWWPCKDGLKNKDKCFQKLLVILLIQLGNKTEQVSICWFVCKFVSYYGFRLIDIELRKTPQISAVTNSYLPPQSFLKKKGMNSVQN